MSDFDVRDHRTEDTSFINSMNYSTSDTFRLALCSYDSVEGGGPSDMCFQSPLSDQAQQECKDMSDTQILLNRGFPRRQARNNVILSLQDQPCATLDQGRRMLAFAAFDTDTIQTGGLTRMARRLTRNGGSSRDPFDIVMDLRERYRESRIGNDFGESIPMACNVFDCARTLIPLIGDTLVHNLDENISLCQGDPETVEETQG